MPMSVEFRSRPLPCLERKPSVLAMTIEKTVMAISISTREKPRRFRIEDSALSIGDRNGAADRGTETGGRDDDGDALVVVERVCHAGKAGIARDRDGPGEVVAP